MHQYTETIFGILGIFGFVIAYAFVASEELHGLRKSKPVLVSAGALWFLVAIAYELNGEWEHAVELFNETFLELTKLVFFLLVAMTFVNKMEERHVFSTLREFLVNRGLTYQRAFWVTGGISFFLSAWIDNLTTALVMGSVVMAIGIGHPKFILLGCINVVVAANAGGAWNAFGDITTLMVWQSGKVDFINFWLLLPASLVNWFVPAFLMSRTGVPKGVPERSVGATSGVQWGGKVVVALFASTIAFVVSTRQILHMDPVVGMLFGLGLLMTQGYFIRRHEGSRPDQDEVPLPRQAAENGHTNWRAVSNGKPYDIMVSVRNVEWDTLLFFVGIILSVGALAALGYLALLSEWAYGTLGPTLTNALVGILSAVVDNIPVMYSVLQMDPSMGHSEWLLVTLTAGVGGSLLSIGSAAGVALMGRAHGVYTFGAHWRVGTFPILAGYMLSVLVHHFIISPLIS